MMAAWAFYIEQEMTDGGLRDYLQTVLNEYWTKTPFKQINADDYITRLEPQIIVNNLNDL